MLALVSISSDNAIGRLVRLKKVSSCLVPSSKTENSCSVEIGDVAILAVDDRHVQRHDVNRGREDLRLLLRLVDEPCARATSSQLPENARPGLRSRGAAPSPNAVWSASLCGLSPRGRAANLESRLSRGDFDSSRVE